MIYPQFLSFFSLLISLLSGFEGALRRNEFIVSTNLNIALVKTDQSQAWKQSILTPLVKINISDEWGRKTRQFCIYIEIQDSILENVYVFLEVRRILNLMQKFILHFIVAISSWIF